MMVPSDHHFRCDKTATAKRPAQRRLVGKLAVVAADVERMAEFFLEMNVHTVVDGADDQVRNAAAELRADAGEFVIRRIDDGVIATDLRQKVADALGKRALLILADKQRDGRLCIDDLQFLAFQHLLCHLAIRAGTGCKQIFMINV